MSPCTTFSSNTWLSAIGRALKSEQCVFSVRSRLTLLVREVSTRFDPLPSLNTWKLRQGRERPTNWLINLQLKFVSERIKHHFHQQALRSTVIYRVKERIEPWKYWREQHFTSNLICALFSKSQGFASYRKIWSGVKFTWSSPKQQSNCFPRIPLKNSSIQQNVLQKFFLSFCQQLESRLKLTWP